MRRRLLLFPLVFIVSLLPALALGDDSQFKPIDLNAYNGTPLQNVLTGSNGITGDPVGFLVNHFWEILIGVGIMFGMLLIALDVLLVKYIWQDSWDDQHRARQRIRSVLLGLIVLLLGPTVAYLIDPSLLKINFLRSIKPAPTAPQQQPAPSTPTTPPGQCPPDDPSCFVGA